MEVKPGYKQTEVGVIPEDWDVSALSSLASMKSGESITSINIDQFSKYPCYGGNGLRGYTTRYTHSGRHALIGRQGALCGNVIGVEGEFFASEHAIVVTTSSQSSIEWLTFVLGRMNLNRYSESSAQPGLSVAKILLVVAAPPTLAEQEAIAGALSDADALIVSLEQLIAKKRLVKQGAMQELLTGKRRLPGFEKKVGYKQTEVGLIPEDWEAKTIDSVAFVTSGKRLPLGRSLTEHETPHPYIRVADMRPGTVSLDDIMYVPEEVFPYIKRYRIFIDDIFISVAGSLGIVGKIPPELNGANLTENADRITNIICFRDFLLHILMSPLIQNTIESLQTIGAQPKLALTRIRKFEVTLPPTIEEQSAIASVLSEMDAEISALEGKLVKVRQIKQGMMQELLTGRIRLV